MGLLGRMDKISWLMLFLRGDFGFPVAARVGRQDDYDIQSTFLDFVGRGGGRLLCCCAELHQAEQALRL